MGTGTNDGTFNWKQHVMFFVMTISLWGGGQGFMHDDRIISIANLSRIKEGTELSVFEVEDILQSTYKLEDFFWTGSGDGPSSSDEEHTTTIYSTQTIFITPTALINQTVNSSITPTSANNHEDYEDLDADRQFWLLTVLKSDGKDLDLLELRKSLANLYKKAFLRQQALHLRIRTKRQVKDKPINVYIHKLDKSPLNGDDKIEVVYHVAVAGQPVDAVIASEDMRLVTDKEVKEELGFPFLVKAEPYIKPTVAEGVSSVRPAWLFITLSSIVLLIILIAIVALACFITKKKQPPKDSTRERIFEEVDDAGRQNDGFSVGEKSVGNRRPSPTYINFKDNSSNDILHHQFSRPQSEQSSSSCNSIDISPLIGLSNRKKVPQRPKAAVAINKTVPLPTTGNNSPKNDVNDSSLSSTDTFCIKDRGVVSPKSFLSMPSVKSFPRGNNPEPLNKVLEPVSVVHLDMMHDDEVDGKSYERDFKMLRHGSLNNAEDPGVIGPVVWNLHKHRLEHGESLAEIEGLDDYRSTSNVSRMRKRFHDLLDDTFSLFGSSRRESPLHSSQMDVSPVEVKSHSALGERNVTKTIAHQRPKTSEPRKNVNMENPKGAWTSHTPSPLVRPISAPYRPQTAVPRINRELILVDGILKQSDPAIPLIEEIKKEIDRCSLPGSTKNLND